MNWIKTNDKLPEMYALVIVFTTDVEIKMARRISSPYEYELWESDRDGKTFGGVTHWMPLPTTPEK